MEEDGRNKPVREQGKRIIFYFPLILSSSIPSILIHQANAIHLPGSRKVPICSHLNLIAHNPLSVYVTSVSIIIRKSIG